MAASSVAGILLNFATQAYLAYKFGAGTEMDAYVAAMALPALLITVFIPSVSIVLIPIFVETMQKSGADAAWRMASNLLNLVALVLAAGVAIALWFAGPLMRRIVPGVDAATLSLSIELLRWLLPATIVAVVAGTLAALYQAQERFWSTAVAPLIGTAVLLGSAIALIPSYGMRGVAIATVAGNTAQVLYLLPVLRGRYRPVLNVRDDHLRKIALLLAPLIFGGLIVRATIIADRLVASLLPKGSLSHLEYAMRIAAVINAVFASGIAAALYPRMSTQAAASDLSSLRESLVWGQRLLMLFLFPALTIGWVLRVPLLQLVLERGQFTPADTHAVAAIVSWFMLGVVGAALGVLQARVYYVLKDTQTPVLLGFLETAAYFAYLPFLAKSFGAVGVGMANAVYLISALILNGVVVLRKLHSGGASDLLASAARIGLFALAGGAVAWIVAATLRGPMSVLAVGTIGGALTYCLLLLAIRADEVRLLRSLLIDVGAEDAA
jgi:putative peptidoglycan lipid II flippase